MSKNQSCFENGVLPDIFKSDIVKSLYKSGDKLQIVNSKPISLSSNVTKTLKKVIKKIIKELMKKYQRGSLWFQRGTVGRRCNL